MWPPSVSSPEKTHPNRVNIHSHYRFNICTMNLNPFQSSVVFQIETSHLICIGNQITGFYIKCNIRLKGLIISNSLRKFWE